MATKWASVVEVYRLVPIPEIDDMRLQTLYYQRTTPDGGIEVTPNVDSAALLSAKLAERITHRLQNDEKFKSGYTGFKVWEKPADEKNLLFKLEEVGEPLPKTARR